MVDVITQHIEIVPGAGGPKARIAGQRIRVLDIAIWHEKMGLSVAEIVRQFSSLSPADVYAALTYYWDHREEIEQAILEEYDLVEELRRSGPGPLARHFGEK